MSKTKTIIGKIYANWCGHCQQLKPEWSKMKTNLKQNAHLQIIEIEESQNELLTEFKSKHPNLQINGYPTIFKIHSNGAIEYYSGDRKANEMQKWALRKKGGKQTFRRKKRTKNS
jgi:thiol-disulfide isomerase/thioredoxin